MAVEGGSVGSVPSKLFPFSGERKGEERGENPYAKSRPLPDRPRLGGVV